MNRHCQCLLIFTAAFLFLGRASAQFIDDFNGPSVQTDPDGTKGWMFLAGDGTATMNFRQGGDGYASIFVDGTTDKRGIPEPSRGLPLSNQAEKTWLHPQSAFW